MSRNPGNFSGIEGAEFFPTEIEKLHDRIRGSMPFVSMGEAGAFASSAVRIMLDQERRIAELERAILGRDK